MKSMVALSHEFLKPALHPQAVCIDATLGNGKDTRFFLEHKVGHVYGFEIQKEIFERTVKDLDPRKFTGMRMSHESIDQIHQADAIVFKFGYCPGADPDITTLAKTSVTAVEKAIKILRRKGRMALVFYPHPQGVEESRAIEAVLVKYTDTCSMIRIEQIGKESPYMIGIEKNR